MNFEEHLLVSDEDDCRNLLSDGSEDEETNSDNDEPFNQQISMQNEQAIPGQLPPPEEDLLFIRIQPTPNIQFVQSNKGNPMLFYQGFFHYLRNTRLEKNGVGDIVHTYKTFYCAESRKGCQMQVQFMDDQYLKELKAGHNHLADPVKAKKKLIEQTAKQTASQNPELSNRLIINYAMRDAAEPVIGAINTEALRKSLERRKRKQMRYPKGKTDPANLQIPEEWLGFENGEPFVIHDSGKQDSNRFIVLSSNFMLQKLVQAKTIAMDGTFRTRPRKWEQIFSIHVCNNGRFVPAVAIIMSKKNRVSYVALFQKLTAYMEGLFQIVWNPEIILTDFEIAQRSAIRSHFPGARHKCCFFHYAQAIQRWITKVKLDQKYQTDVHFNEYIGMFRCLAFVPQRFLVSSFNQLVNFENDEIRQFGREADYPGLARFIAYFKTSWVCKESEHGNLSPRFPIDLWNHRDEALAGNPTTTCALESWHRSINAVTRERGQSMWKCLKLFSTEIGTISRNQWIQISSLSTPDRHETKTQRETLVRFQTAILGFNGLDPIRGLQSMIRRYRNVVNNLPIGERERMQAMQEEQISQCGTPITTRRRRRRN